MHDVSEMHDDDIVDLGAATDRTNGDFDLHLNEGWLRPQRKPM